MSISTYISTACKYYEKCLSELIESNYYLELSYPINNPISNKVDDLEGLVKGFRSIRGHFYNLNIFKSIDLLKKLRLELECIGDKSQVIEYNRDSILGRHNISFYKFKEYVEILILVPEESITTESNLSLRLIIC